MATTPRPWYRSPTLWFFLPGLVFLLWAWVFSMQREANLDFEIGAYSVSLQNDGSTVGASWYEDPGLPPSGAIPREFHFSISARPTWAKTDWFPLPSYVVHPMSSPPWHYLDVSYWFLLLIYVALWQLPWLARYHRRRRIDRALTLARADAVKAEENV